MARISDAEAQVMAVLWLNSPLSTEDIASELQSRQGWQLTTIKTLLNRLLKKGAVTAVKEGRRYLYSPLLQRTEWVDEQATGLLDRLFGGSLAPLVARFTSQRRLEPADLAAIKKLLKDYERG